ncbi:MAG TPA: SdrD B-like domain-containing protein [Acidimicrobiales bacterium]|nr:SdrD B-like domain-containing protein [Acidimicrobiales bacterium]
MAVAAALAIIGAGFGVSAAEAGTGTISGTAFQDLNRNGVLDSGEPRIPNQQFYLFDGTQTVYYGTTVADGSGRYSFGGLDAASYVVSLEDSAWRAIRTDWVPSTTGSLRPDRAVDLSGAATADFGWRPIVRSTTLGNPISQYAAPNGMRVESYDDVVTAREVYDRVMLGLVGPEAPAVKIHFDLGSGGDTATTSASIGSDGRYELYGADVYASYLSWLDSGDSKLAHEYGHAWSLYHAYITQQDPTFASYLEARDLTGDARLNTSHAWSPREMIAEDYRQLFGSATARAASQENNAILPAASVPGLRRFLHDTFTTAPAGTAPEPAPSAMAVSGMAVNPSPVRSSGVVSWSASGPARVTVTVLNAKGATVRTLLAGVSEPAGTASVAWDRLTDAGRRVGKGTFTARVVATDGSGATATQSVSFSVA